MAEIYKVDASFDHGFFKGTSCAFGVFDGVHRGHRYLLDCARSTAAETGGASVALTFDIDPDEVFHQRGSRSSRRQACACSRTAASASSRCCRSPAISPPRLEEFLVQTFDGTVPSFLRGLRLQFGARAASVRDLGSWAAVGTSVQAHDLKSDDGAPITATRIRLLLAGGDVEEANRLLGRPYFMTGVVEPGRGRSRYGLRTANLVVPDQMRPLGGGVRRLCARHGVLSRRERGVAATFADRATATCEVHLLDLGDLYGKPVKVEFLHWLRL
ncbi:MAG: riboflavin kinase [Eggerthella lenta]